MFHLEPPWKSRLFPGAGNSLDKNTSSSLGPRVLFKELILGIYMLAFYSTTLMFGVTRTPSDPHSFY